MCRSLSLATAGLFIARVGLELTCHPWPSGVVIAAGLLLACGGFLLGWRLRARGGIWWPAWLLLVYVVWPRRDLGLAALTGGIALLTWLLLQRARSLPGWAALLADALTFAAALAVYSATVAPDVLPADAGEFQLVAARLGVAHPPGFPLYTLIGHLFVRLAPWDVPAYRLNLMSAVLAAASLALLANATRRWARLLGAQPMIALAAGIIAAFVLGGSTTFWAQATIANIRMPSVFFVALSLYALARYTGASATAEGDLALLLFGLALGMGVAHHPSLAFPGLFFVLYALLIRPRLALEPRRWWRPVVVGLAAALLPLLYLPIRGAMGAVLAPPDLDTGSGFLHHVLARGFAGDMFAYANAADIGHRLALLPTLGTFQFSPVLLVLSGLGLVCLVGRNWRLALMLLGSVALHTFVAITYRAPQTVEYLMPGAYPALAVAVGLLPACLTRPLPRWTSLARWQPAASALLSAVALSAAVHSGALHAASFIELSSDRSTRDMVAPLLENAPADALVLADWHWATPMWYLQQIEGLRPDVEVRYVYNVAGEDYRETWRRHIEANDPERSLILTHFYEFDGYTTEPWQTVYLIRRRPVTQPVGALSSLDTIFDGHLRVLGFSVQLAAVQPGEPIECVLAWQALAEMNGTESFTLRLLDDGGNRVAQADRSLMSTSSGEVRFERLVLPVYPTLPPGTYQLALGTYTVTEAGFSDLLTGEGAAVAPLGAVEVEPRSTAPFTLRRQWVSFRAGPTLVGVDYDRSVEGTLRVYLHWQGPVEPGWQARLRADEGSEAAVRLPAMQAGTYQTVAIDLPAPAASTLRLALVSPSGAVAVGAGPAGWALGEVALPRARAGDRFVALGDEMAVVGVSAQAAAPGETTVVDVTLVGLHALTRDISTSVRLVASDGRWLARHDMQPALGAVPTLKWIRGSRVVDRHLLPMPVDADVRDVQMTLVAYERFGLATLPPMDARFGEVPLGAWSQP